ncbi:MAG: putative quinol monooxygenase [Alphaproteobacteria bacterium]
MPRALYALLALAAFLPIAGSHADAQEAAGAVYVVTHVDVTPPNTAQGLAVLKDQAAATRKDDGNLRAELLQQSDRKNHFVLLETWRDQKAKDAHDAADHTKDFRAKLQPLAGSPFDERSHAIVQ